MGAWEQAYGAFETPAQERRKFLRRLRRLGVVRWRRELLVVELFCGHGNGLAAWRRLGFERLVGLDLSWALLNRPARPAPLVVADARQLPFQAGSLDVVCVQGGLHHVDVTADLPRVLAEMRRVLKRDGRAIVVEPWRTPFLDLVHGLCERGLVRRLSTRVNALARMIELEGETYRDWLRSADRVNELLDTHLVPISRRVAFGKLMLVAAPRA
jgi:ubiquinone/menaquinone biosynthesis C-methylase UbiE